MLAARALYSNVSESPEELSFNQDDVLTVLQKDINGLSGWWLCFIDGRIGLAPGNRLRVLSHVELDAEEKQLEAEDDLLRSAYTPADDLQRIQAGKGSQQRNGIDPKDAQQIYDVPPIRNSSSPLPQVTDGRSPNASDKPPEIIYDVPPSSSSAIIYDRPRRVEFAEEAEYQVPRSIRNLSPVPHMSQTGDANLDVSRGVPLKEAIDAPGVLPTNSGRSWTKNAVDGRMGNVRVFVEDDDEISSEEFVGTSIARRKARGSDIVQVFLSAEPENRIPSIYDSVSKETGKTDEPLKSFPKRRSPTFHDSRFSGNAATLPRMTEVGIGRSGERNRTLDQRYADQRFYDQGTVPTIATTSSVSGPCSIKQLVVYNQRKSNRDSLLDDYSVPANRKTLPSPRYRPSSDSFSLHQMKTTELTPIDRRPLKDFGKTRRAHSEVRSPSTSYRPRSETENGNGGSEYQLSFVDTGIYVDCPQDPDSVSDMMESLHQTVRCQAAKIRELCLGHEFSSSYTPKHEADIAQMKMSCLSLRTALKEFADLGTGALANAMQSPTRDLSENILQQLEMLRVFSQDLNSSVYSVINASRGEPVGGQINLRDALNSLLTLTQDIVLPLSSLTDIVTKNSAVIFSAGNALAPASALPAIMDIRSSSPTVPSSQVAPLGTAKDFSPLSSYTLSPVSVIEMRPGSPNLPYIQNPSQGNLQLHGSVVRDSKAEAILCAALPQNHGAAAAAAAASLQNHRSSSPMMPVQGLSPDFRTASPIALSPSSTSHFPVAMVSGAPGKLEPTKYLQTRPLPFLPSGEGTAANSDWRCSPTGYANDVSDWKCVESDYASIANEAERDMKRNVQVLVGRLTDRSKDSQFLRPDESSRTPGKNQGGLSPQFKERMDALRPTTEQTMRMSCTGSRSNSSRSSSKEIAGFFSEFLTGIDREIVQFYVEEVRGHCDAVEFATDDFLCAVTDGSTTGSDLVALSRRVVLAAHKLLYAGDAITKKLNRDEKLRCHVGSIASELCARLKRTVAASKADADAGASLRRQQMIECMTQVKLLSLKLKGLIFLYVFDRIK